MKSLFFLFIASCIALNGCSQNNVNKKQQSKNKTHVGGSCEGCEAVFESLVPFEQLNETDTLPDFNDPGPKIEISGIVYKRDGKTPAPGIIIYVYHTDQKGIYATKGNESGWAKRHGYIRGWMKTNEKGEYRLLVAPDPNEIPWPAGIRVGGGANGFALLQDVSIGYELWRQFNGFPPNFYNDSSKEEKKSKP